MSGPPTDSAAAGVPSTGPPFRANDLEFLRKQAKALLRAVRAGDSVATARYRAIFGAALNEPATLSRAQLVIAREAGFASWPKLRDELRWRKEVRANIGLGRQLRFNKER